MRRRGSSKATLPVVVEFVNWLVCVTLAFEVVVVSEVVCVVRVVSVLFVVVGEFVVVGVAGVVPVHFVIVDRVNVKSVIVLSVYVGFVALSVLVVIVNVFVVRWVGCRRAVHRYSPWDPRRQKIMKKWPRTRMPKLTR